MDDRTCVSSIVYVSYIPLLITLIIVMFYSQIRIVQVKATTLATPKGLSGEEDRSDKLQAYGCGLSLSSEKYLIVLR